MIVMAAEKSFSSIRQFVIFFKCAH